MKTLYLTETGRIIIDPEKSEALPMECDREAIRNVYLINEPMHVVYSSGEKKKELDVNENDIIIEFYERDFPNPLVVANSSEWVDNIKAYRTKQQKIKEEWAKSNKLIDSVSDAIDCDIPESCDAPRGEF